MKKNLMLVIIFCLLAGVTTAIAAQIEICGNVVCGNTQNWDTIVAYGTSASVFENGNIGKLGIPFTPVASVIFYAPAYHVRL